MGDFFYDDVFCLKWDDMPLYSNTLEEFPRIGMMIFHWVRKVWSRELKLLLVFMMFCSVFYILVGVKTYSFHSSIVIESMSLAVQFGSLERHTFV